MGHIRVKSNTGNLYFDFQYLKLRCREYTSLPDLKANRKKLQSVLKRIEAEIALGSFQYAKYFPQSSMLEKVEALEAKMRPDYIESPKFKDFAEEWFSELEPTWRTATAKMYRQYLDKRLIPHFGEMEVSQITKADILKYRSSVAKQSEGKLKAKTINKFIKALNMVMNEAADRYNFTPPHLNIKPLKEEKVNIEPFSIDEVNLILSRVRADWRDYLLVRFFTGMRTGEIDGLKWENVDFARREILIRETYSGDRWEYTKNDGSQREIDMSTLVLKTLQSRFKQFNPKPSDLVFAMSGGINPVHPGNFLRRVWKPLLASLGLKYRKPYQTRHTAATLWLAAGENPNWIANQMGHSTTIMLFSVYARYVPNLTHQDGSAMDRLLSSSVQLQSSPVVNLDDVRESKREGGAEQQSPVNSSHTSASNSERKAELKAEINHWDQILQNVTQNQSSQHQSRGVR